MFVHKSTVFENVTIFSEALQETCEITRNIRLNRRLNTDYFCNLKLENVAYTFNGWTKSTMR